MERGTPRGGLLINEIPYPDLMTSWSVLGLEALVSHGKDSLMSTAFTSMSMESRSRILLRPSPSSGIPYPNASQRAMKAR